MFTMTNFLISVFIFTMIITPVLLTMSGMIDEQKDVINQYEQAMQVYEQEQANLQKQVADYRARADSLHADADELRMQLDAVESDYQRAVSGTPSKSEPARVYPRGWNEKMAGVLRECTAIAEERDRIALLYNELRSQCKLR